MIVTLPSQKIANKGEYVKPIAAEHITKESHMTTTNNEEVTLTADERTELEELRAYKLRQAQKGSTIKVSAKGGVSIYGLGRFPVTLYKSQWKKLLGQAKEIAQFIVDHNSELASKE